MNNNELIISGRHLELTESLKTFVREKTEKLFRHEDRIVRIRIELEVDRIQTRAKDYLFTAKGIIEIMGPDMVASETSEDMHKSIDLLVSKLDRMIRRRSRLAKVKRNHPHSVEIPALLPKIAPA
jgi:putative sigma-54 modulation protein